MDEFRVEDEAGGLRSFNAVWSAPCVEQSASLLEPDSGYSMIRHFVFFTAQKEDDLATIRDGLRLLTRIPHAARLEIALNRKSDPTSKEVDVVVYGEFTDDAALAAYKAHELYAEAILRVKPLREMRYAADYDAKQAFTTAADDA